MGGLGGGHYTAYALNHLTQQWYEFDDSTCSRADAAQTKSSSAYVLFYRRREKGQTTATKSWFVCCDESTTIKTEKLSSFLLSCPPKHLQRQEGTWIEFCFRFASWLKGSNFLGNFADKNVSRKSPKKVAKRFWGSNFQHLSYFKSHFSYYTQTWVQDFTICSWDCLRLPLFTHNN
jgi:hypothetical protein